MAWRLAWARPDNSGQPARGPRAAAVAGPNEFLRERRIDGQLHRVAERGKSAFLIKLRMLMDASRGVDILGKPGLTINTAKNEIVFMRLVVVSNRLPFTLAFKEGLPEFRPSAGGLATGLWSYLNRKALEGAERPDYLPPHDSPSKINSFPAFQAGKALSSPSQDPRRTPSQETDRPFHVHDTTLSIPESWRF